MIIRKNASRTLAWLLSLALLLSSLSMSIAETEHVHEATPGEAEGFVPEDEATQETPETEAGETPESDAAEDAPQIDEVEGAQEDGVIEDLPEDDAAEDAPERIPLEEYAPVIELPEDEEAADEGAVMTVETDPATCAHEIVVKNRREDTTGYKPNGNDTHIRVYNVWVHAFCYTCGADLPAVLEKEGVESAPERCDYGIGLKCYNCGGANTCTHEKTDISSYMSSYSSDIQYKSNGDGATHTRTGTFVTIEKCLLCGYWLSQQEEPQYQDVAACYFERDGVCKWCGQENTCLHTSTHVEILYDGCYFETHERYEPYSAAQHRRVYDRQGEEVCDVCGVVVSYPILEKDLFELEPHWFEDGVCYWCKYEQPAGCEHKLTNPDFVYNVGYIVGLIGSDSTTHTYAREVYVVETCMSCEAPLGPLETRIIEETSRHNYSYGLYSTNVCRDCGYNRGDCTHENIEYEGYVTGSYYYHFCTTTGFTPQEDGHIVHINWESLTGFCADCGDLIYGISHGIYGGPRDVFEPHTNPNGICYVCGYDSRQQNEESPGEEPTATPAPEQPTATPEPEQPAETPALEEPTETPVPEEPTATPEPDAEETATPAPEEPAVTPAPETPDATPAPEQPGDSTGSGSGSAYYERDTLMPTPKPTPATLEMMEALLDFTALAGGDGDEVSIEFAGTRELLTDAEYAQLETLPVREQILVVLRAAGMIDSAIPALEGDLSPEGQALLDAIAARLDAAGDEERAAMEEVVRSNFPVTQVESGGVTTAHCAVELRVTANGVQSVQRFDFRQESDGRWVLSDTQSVLTGADQTVTWVLNSVQTATAGNAQAQSADFILF